MTLDLLEHARAKLADLHNNAMAITACAHGLAALCAATAVARRAKCISGDGKLTDFAIVTVFQGHLESMHHVFSLFRPTWTTAPTTVEHVKEIRVATSTVTSLFYSLFAILVVKFSLLRVRKHFVGLLNFFEKVWIATSVGVVFQSKLAVSFLDFCASGILF
jgi:hypothetical protein